MIFFLLERGDSPEYINEEAAERGKQRLLTSFPLLIATGLRTPRFFLSLIILAHFPNIPLSIRRGIQPCPPGLHPVRMYDGWLPLHYDFIWWLNYNRDHDDS